MKGQKQLLYGIKIGKITCSPLCLTSWYLGVSDKFCWYDWVRWVGNLGFWCVWMLQGTCPGKQSNIQNVKVWGQPSYRLWCLRTWHLVAERRRPALPTVWKCLVQYWNLSALRRTLTICFSRWRCGESIFGSQVNKVLWEKQQLELYRNYR